MEPREYRPVSPRRRLLIVLLTLATVAAGFFTMLERRGQIVRARASAPLCAKGQLVDCVGGMAQVIVAAPASTAPAASAPH
ncbi:MAG: hypothetical protein KGN16_24040 [Burkholderiales bacterium]|nr:hypothetical protein [Burkholderiales bacterium]